MSEIIKLSIRNMKNKKGRTFCVFLSGVICILFLTIVCSIISAIYTTFGEYLRANRLWKGDASIIVYTDEDREVIQNSNLINDSCNMYYLGAVLMDDNSEYMKYEISYFDKKMCDWMGVDLVEGRLPNSADEIVVSDEYLQENGLKYRKNLVAEINYTCAGTTVNKTFKIVGYYDTGECAKKDEILVSRKYYEQQRQVFADNGADFPITVEVVYKQNHGYQKLTEKLISKTSMDIDTAEYLVNNESDSQFGMGMVVSFFFVIFLIGVLGALLIMSTYGLSINSDLKFYKSLYILGISAKELFAIFMTQILLVSGFSALIGIASGFGLSKLVIMPIINKSTTLELEAKINWLILGIPLVVFVVVIMACALKLVFYIYKVVSLSRRAIKPKYRMRHGRCISNLLIKMTLRRIGANKKIFFLISFFLFSGIVIGNGINTYLNGFDVAKYIDEGLYADYTVHSSSFGKSVERREPFRYEELADISDLEGMKNAGGASICDLNVELAENVLSKYKKLQTGTSAENSMYTSLYGVDDILIDKMQVLNGEIDLDKLHTGNYVLIDSFGLEDNGETIWNIGDTITLQNTEGKQKNYIVMAIISLPYDLTYQSKWEDSSDIYLPESEWKSFTDEDDYYIYMFDAEESYHAEWDNWFTNKVSEDSNLVYESAKTKADDNEQFMSQLRSFVWALIFVIILGVLIGFFNIIVNEMIGLKEELINLQRIGVGANKLVMQFFIEAAMYILLGIVTGIIISPIISRYLINDFIAEKYVSYKYDFTLSIVYMLIGIMLVGLAGFLFQNLICRRETSKEKLQ